MKSLVFDYISLEKKRQSNNLELIASENYVSNAVLEAAGSILTNKYAEGYPNKRYYGGCEYVDLVEQLAIDLLKKLFNAEHANVQPHSGSQANMAVYLAVLKPGDVVLGMDLNAGGHLTHGHTLNFSGLSYQFFSYGVNKKSGMIDYQEVRNIAHKVRPKLIVAGASAYSRIIDFAAFRQIADEVGAYLMVDMAHIAGLIAAKLHPSPVPHAHFVTSTTHKTMRGPRGGFILCQKEFQQTIDRAVFPGVQGGPLMHIIAAKAICFEEALLPEFTTYQMQVMKNAKALASSLQEEGFEIISGTTDNHLLLVNTIQKTGLSGKEAEALLDQVNITCNKNTIPFDSLPPNKTSGIRLGSPALTTRGFNEEDFYQIGKLISSILNNPSDQIIKDRIKESVKELTRRYPL